MPTDIIEIFKHANDWVPYSAGQVIFTEGEPGALMYVINEGQVDIVIHGTVVETVGEGGLMGEMALIDGHVRSATARARTDCRLVPIDQKRFTFLVQQTPYFAVHVMRIMADRVRRLQDYIPRQTGA